MGAAPALLDSYIPPPFAAPFAKVGRQTFDGKGNTEGTATLSSNGNINQVTFEGTYTVKPDCTGSMKLYIPAFGATVHADFVIDHDGTEIRAIVTETGGRVWTNRPTADASREVVGALVV